MRNLDYSKLLPNLSTQLAPLYSLLQKKTTCSWGKAQQQAFEEAKKQFASSSQLLAMIEKDLLLVCGASPYGVGAFITQNRGWI